MGFSSEIYKKALDKLSERRMTAEREADERRRRIYERLPRVRELERGISSGGIRAARAVIGGGDVKAEMEKLRRENLALQAELKDILVKNGYSEDELEPRYSCSKCSDTGYIEDRGRTIVCPCLKSALSECACEELNRQAPLSLSTFDAFSLEYYPKTPDSNGIVPYNHADKVLKFCKGYAANFTTSSGNILMTGETGLGKTHLSLAIANEVIRRGYSVIYVTAPALIQRVEKASRARIADDELIETLSDSDLLIIDDLGTEYHNQYTVSNMYNIINSRLLTGKPLIINTNLTLGDMEKIYSARLVSRLVGSGLKLNFVGEDIRVKKRRVN